MIPNRIWRVLKIAKTTNEPTFVSSDKSSFYYCMSLKVHCRERKKNHFYRLSGFGFSIDVCTIIFSTPIVARPFIGFFLFLKSKILQCFINNNKKNLSIQTLKFSEGLNHITVKYLGEGVRSKIYEVFLTIFPRNCTFR